MATYRNSAWKYILKPWMNTIESKSNGDFKNLILSVKNLLKELHK